MQKAAPLPFAIAAGALAGAFAATLARDLSPVEWRTMRVRNRYLTDDTCASHDFCDANMNMAEAFADIVGREPLDDDGMSDASIELWNAAWGIAKPLYLTSTLNDWSTRGDAFDAWRCSGIDVGRLNDHQELVGEVDGEHGGRIYAVGFVERVAYGAGEAIACVAGNQDILTQDLFEAERFLWDHYAASETQHG